MPCVLFQLCCSCDVISCLLLQSDGTHAISLPALAAEYADSSGESGKSDGLESMRDIQEFLPDLEDMDADHPGVPDLWCIVRSPRPC